MARPRILIWVFIQCPCGEEFETFRPERSRYCSKKCLYKFRVRPKGIKQNFVNGNRGWFHKGHIPDNKYKRREFKGKSKDGLHGWVERNLGKAKERICEKCGLNKNMQWSNKSGKYKRELSDWQRLCAKCHQRYDWEKFGARKTFYEGGNPRLKS